MSDDVRDAYNAWSREYTALALGDLDRDLNDWVWLKAFAERSVGLDGPIADMGCGPGHIVNHLSQLGLPVVGYDLSPALIAEAENRFPDDEFHVGDLSALDIADSSLGGIVARYSLIHMLPSRLEAVFERWLDHLEPGAPLLVSFFAAPSTADHGSPFDHAVVTAYALFPATIATQLQRVGFVDAEVGMRAPIEGERPLDHGTVLARKPDTS